jgi:uncharacterized protein (TIGR01777 family)
MSTFDATVDLPVSAQEAFRWHERPGAFARLAPPGDGVRVLSGGGDLASAAPFELAVPIGPFSLRWVGHHCDFRAGEQFCDVLDSGPFASWRHTHRFLPTGAESCRLVDHIEYRPHLGRLGALVAGSKIAGQLRRLFAHRHRRTAADLQRHHAQQGATPWRVALSGATGLIGRTLTDFLGGGGHRVQALVRRAARVGSDEIAWDPQGGQLDTAALAGCSAVVHLAGCGISAQRWSPAYKDLIRSSRVAATHQLCTALAAMSNPPRTLLCASAIGWYGDRGDEELDERSAAGTGFLSTVCQEWEEATAPARAAGIRVVLLRTGIVLAAGGGALRSMLPALRAGVGGRLGSGRQWMSWIALDDAIGAIHHLLASESVHGAVNLVAPHPCTNRDFTATAARALHRPAVLPVPGALVRLALGEMGQSLLLGGARIRPRVLVDSGFRFLQPELPGALHVELGLD